MLVCICCMAFVATELENALNLKQLSVALVCFLGWNIFTFHRSYILQHINYGAHSNEFHAGPYHDNAKDFRPYQRVASWAFKLGCADKLTWIEDDRFSLPLEFAVLSLKYNQAVVKPADKIECPYLGHELFFSHIPNYDLTKAPSYSESNTPSPNWDPSVRLNIHFANWGDLAIWKRSH